MIRLPVELVGSADGRRDAGRSLRPKSLELGWRRPSDRCEGIVRDVRLDRRLEGGHPQETSVAHGCRLVLEPDVCGVVALVVRDHERDVRPFGGVDHRRTLPGGEAHRLLDEDVNPGPGSLDRHRSVAAGREHQDGVDRLAQQVSPIRADLRDAVPLGARGRVLRGDVADRGDLEAVRQLAQVVEVHDLRDETRSDHAHPHPRRSRARRHGGARRQGRSFDGCTSGRRRARSDTEVG